MTVGAAEEEEQEGWKRSDGGALSFFFLFPIWLGRVLVCGLRITFIHLSARQDKEKHFQVGNLYSDLE